MALQSSLHDWLVRYGKRIGLVASVHALKKFVQGFLFDTLLYGAVVTACTSTWGYAWGTMIALCIMCPLAALYCYSVIRVYDWSQKDLLGLEALKKFRDVDSGSWWTRFVASIVRKGDAWAFLALSVYGDAILVVIYLRKGIGQYNGLSTRDWKIFWASVFVSNLYWTLRWSVIVEAARFIWSLLF